MLLIKFPQADICLAGDKNDLNVKEITNCIPNLRQIFTPPTYKAKTIDVILTTMTSYYKQAIVVDPIEPDQNSGKPSDHKMVLLYPTDNLHQIRKVTI